MSDYIRRESPKRTSEADLVKQINDYMATHKSATRNELRRKLNTSFQRMEILEAKALIKLPPMLNKSMGATLSRKRNNVGLGWYISRPAEWQK